MDDGWDDDDVVFDSEEESQEQEPNSNDITEPDAANASGWDDDGLDFDDDDTNSAAPLTSPSSKIDETQSGWGHDDDDLNFDDDWGDDNVESAKKDQEAHSYPDPTGPSDLQKDRLLQELDAYVKSLLHNMGSSINAILELDYNTPMKAQELVEYYASRPGLAEYTRTKELPRMEYLVVLPDGQVETDKQQIAEHLLPDFVARCANQSLLADLIQVLTGPDRVVRPQYLSICVARRCQFTIHLNGNGDNTAADESVNVKTELHLSLPTAQGDRLEVALIRASIMFVPHEPSVEFRIHDIQIAPSLTDPSQLKSTVDFLVMAMEGDPLYDSIPQQEVPADVDRDQFLQNTQQMFHQSTAGMKSALQQVESIVNIKSKMKILSNFIPDTGNILAAEEETMEFVREQMQPEGPPPRPLEQQPGLFPRPAAAKHERPPQEEQQSKSRPKSILGGLVSSGLNVLAKSVTLPDVDDQEIYGPPVEPPPSKVPMFYRKDSPPAKQRSFSPALIYRRDDTSNPSQSDVITTERNEGLSPVANSDLPTTNSANAPNAVAPDSGALPNSNIVDDGWDDDDIDLEEENDGFEDDLKDDTEVATINDGQEPNIPYNPEDDIIETRKRWINPIKHSRLSLVT